MTSPTSTPWLVKSLASGTDPGGGYLVAAEHYGDLIDALRPDSVLLRSGVSVIRTSAESLLLPRIVTDPTAVWRGEGESLAGSGDPTFGMLRATPRKVASYVAAPRELLDDSSPGMLGVLERQISQALALALDAAAFGGTTVNALAAPIPLRDVVGITTLDMNGSMITAGFGWLVTMIGRYLVAHGNLDRAAWYLHPSQWESILRITNDGLPGSGTIPAVLQQQRLSADPSRTVLGIPVHITSQIPTNEATTDTESPNNGLCSSIYLVDTQHLAVVMRQDARVDVDRSRHFDEDVVALRGVLRADIVALQPATVIRLKGVAPSS